MMMRAELMYPGMQIFKETHTFNVFVTGHGLIMVFFMIMPAMIGGFGNWLVPLMIGAPDMAFPRMNNIVLAAAGFFTFLILSMFVEGDSGGTGVGGGWTLYAPSTYGSPWSRDGLRDLLAAHRGCVVDPGRRSTSSPTRS